jgi:peptide/nickel transport system permease protein
MTSGRRWASLAPLGALFGLALGASRSARSIRLDPALSRCSPSTGHPLGCGEGGVDLLAVVSRAELGGLALAASVALFGFAVGTPLGAAAALARGRLERSVARAADLIQAFPTFLLALVILAAVRSPSRVHLAIVFGVTAWAPSLGSRSPRRGCSAKRASSRRRARSGSPGAPSSFATSSRSSSAS